VVRLGIGPRPGHGWYRIRATATPQPTLPAFSQHSPRDSDSPARPIRVPAPIGKPAARRQARRRCLKIARLAAAPPMTAGKAVKAAGIHSPASAPGFQPEGGQASGKRTRSRCDKALQARAHFEPAEGRCGRTVLIAEGAVPADPHEEGMA